MADLQLSRRQSGRYRLRRCLLIVAVVCSTLSSPAPAQARPARPASSKKAAAAAYAQGIQRFKDLDYEGAMEAFERSYFLSGNYLAMCNIARCQERRHDLINAARAYQRCLEEGGRASRAASQLEGALAAIEARITRVRVVSPGEGGTVYLNGKLRGPAPAELVLNPGTYVLEVRREGARPALLTVEATGGSREVRMVPGPIVRPPPITSPPPPRLERPAPPPSRRRLSPTWFWSCAGVSLGLAVAGTVMGILTITENQSYQDRPSLLKYDRVLDYRLATNILFGAAGAAAGTTLLLFFYTDFAGASRSDEAGTTTMVGLRGRF